MIAVGVGKWGISAMLLHHKWFMSEEKTGNGTFQGRVNKYLKFLHCNFIIAHF